MPNDSLQGQLIQTFHAVENDLLYIFKDCYNLCKNLISI